MFLKRSLLEYRDQSIGNRAYEQNSELKRYGYRVRKYITCQYDDLQQVRFPRIRSKDREVRCFADKYMHFSAEMIE